MNIIALSDQKQNIFFCYKLAQATGNIKNFNVMKLHKEKESVEFNINHNDKDHVIKLWTSYEKVTEKNNGYVILLTELSEYEYSKKTSEFMNKVSSYDPQYKFILFVNVVDVAKYKMENKNIYITPIIGKQLVKPFKMDDLINPCAFACCDKLYSIAAQLSNNEHFNFITELFTNMATGWGRNDDKKNDEYDIQ